MPLPNWLLRFIGKGEAQPLVAHNSGIQNADDVLENGSRAQLMPNHVDADGGVIHGGRRSWKKAGIMIFYTAIAGGIIATVIFGRNHTKRVEHWSLNDPEFLTGFWSRFNKTAVGSPFAGLSCLDFNHTAAMVPAQNSTVAMLLDLRNLKPNATLPGFDFFGCEKWAADQSYKVAFGLVILNLVDKHRWFLPLLIVLGVVAAIPPAAYAIYQYMRSRRGALPKLEPLAVIGEGYAPPQATAAAVVDPAADSAADSAAAVVVDPVVVLRRPNQRRGGAVPMVGGNRDSTQMHAAHEELGRPTARLEATGRTDGLHAGDDSAHSEALSPEEAQRRQEQSSAIASAAAGLHGKGKGKGKGRSAEHFRSSSPAPSSTDE